MADYIRPTLADRSCREDSMSRSRGGEWTPQHSQFIEPVFEPYVRLIGQVALAWNDLHERLAHVFWSIMGGGAMERPIGVWNSANFDRARREMLRRAVEASTPRELADHPRLRG